jgi:very-short-patch-repair endonuclease
VSVYASSFLGRPDLVDERLGIVLEADSFEWHGDRAALRSDAQRYNRFVVHGWLVLRFAWEDVMFRPDEVRAILEAAVAERTEHGRRCRCAA